MVYILRILVLVNHDFPSLVAVNHLFDQLDDVHTLQLRLSKGVGSPKNQPKGLSSLADYDAKLLSDSHSDPSDGEHCLHSFQQLDKMHHLGMKFISLHNADDVNQLVEFKPDVVLSIRFGQILQDAVINRLGCPILNLHSGLLPSYRGVMATFWSMLNGDSCYGFTLHAISDSGIDTGVSYGEVTRKCRDTESYFLRLLTLYPPAIDMMANAVETLQGGQLLKPVESKPDRVSRYHTYPSEQQLADFFDKGHTLFDELELKSVLARLG